MSINSFISSLKSHSFENVFNPYTDVCEIHDSYNAPRLRTKAVRGILGSAVSKEVDAIWVGRDLGYRGGRRTGLALTDDMHTFAHGERWGLDFSKFVKNEEKISERTATVIWNELEKLDENILLWNVFPFHPYEPGNPFSNRCHSAKERDHGEDILVELIKLVQPKRLIAIGNNAYASLERISANHKYLVEKVRHPSYGGHSEFIQKIRYLY